MTYAVQDTFDDLGQSLSETTFVVVDLETTGGSPAGCHITEIGAVKVRGGEVLGEFQTLVRPSTPIPAFIQVLTGITDLMVADAPPVSVALPAFLEFAGDAVLVAHNAGFDISFLKAAAAQCDIPWRHSRVLDTVRLARSLVTADEAPNHKLSSLAALFGATQTPDHRALHDARATVDVLHGLIARVGNLGVHTLEELASFTSRVTPAQRRKRFLADGLPALPGVYVFRDSRGRPLYVGTAKDLRRRVRTYFTAAETRRRMSEMVALAESVTPIVCATPLEAEVRELRLIAEHKPPYNRRSRSPERQPWVKLTAEAFPRLSITRTVRPDGATYLGPFPSRATAEAAVAAVHDVVPLRQCTGRLSLRGTGRECALAGMDRCGAPCSGRQSREEYAQVADRVAALAEGQVTEVLDALTARMSVLSSHLRYEEAQLVRDRTVALLRGVIRRQRHAPLASSAEIVAARRRQSGGWEVVCIRYGRLAGTTVTPAGADPMPAIAALRLSAETVEPPGPAGAASAEETEKLLRWLELDGTRLVDVEGTWSCPVKGAEALRDRLEPASHGWDAPRRWDEPTGRPLAQPPAAVRWAG